MKRVRRNLAEAGETVLAAVAAMVAVDLAAETVGVTSAGGKLRGDLLNLARARSRGCITERA